MSQGEDEAKAKALLDTVNAKRATVAHSGGQVVHRRKLFDGKTTAEEVHQRYAFPKGAKCEGCGRPPLTTVRVFAPLEEVVKRDGETFGKALMVLGDEVLKALLTRLFDEPHLRISEVYACKRCTPAITKAAAKLPSWCVVHINEGPGVDNPTSGWTGNRGSP